MNSNNKGKYVTTIIFLCCIFIMALLLAFLPKETFSHTEKRDLATLPEISLSSISSGKFTEDFESYVDDHLPLRKVITGISAYSSYITGNNGANGVYNCKDGYLINTPITDENHLEINLDTVASFAKSVDIPVSAVVVPSTGYIMDDKLPANHEQYLDDEFFEKITKCFKDNDISFTDLRDTFKKNKDNTQIYYKTDHHWTSDGAFLGYKSICDTLKINAMGENSYKKISYDNFYGTTYSTSAFWLTGADTIETWESKDTSFTVKITENGETKKHNSVFFTDRLGEDDKFPVYLNGNHPFTEIINNNRNWGEKLLIIKDSFSHTLAPFLADNFDQVDLVDLRYYKNSVSDLCKKNGYTQILICYGIDNMVNDTDMVWLQ